MAEPCFLDLKVPVGEQTVSVRVEVVGELTREHLRAAAAYLAVAEENLDALESESYCLALPSGLLGDDSGGDELIGACPICRRPLHGVNE